MQKRVLQFNSSKIIYLNENSRIFLLFGEFSGNFPFFPGLFNFPANSRFSPGIPSFTGFPGR